MRAGAAARAAGDGGRMGGRWWRCCASWCARGGLERVPYGPSDARALLHTPQRTGSTSGRQAQAALFSLVRYVNSYVRARSALVPAVRRCGGFERERARAATPNRVGRRAPHTRGGCRACAQPNTVGA